MVDLFDKLFTINNRRTPNIVISIYLFTKALFGRTKSLLNSLGLVKFQDRRKIVTEVGIFWCFIKFILKNPLKQKMYMEIEIGYSQSLCRTLKNLRERFFFLHSIHILLWSNIGNMTLSIYLFIYLSMVSYQ